MDQVIIDNITKNILKIKEDYHKELQYEFICALANAKSIVENKLAVEAQKIAYKAAFSTLAKNLSK
ncbi:MAG: hypothetical protein ABUK08_00145 [Candidatus Humimicrobiaceae bacterium]